MARPRAPVERAKVSGAQKTNPSRFSKRSDPQSGALGEASSWMRGEKIKVWERFRAELPWLKESDRSLVEIAVTIRARLIAGEDVGVSAINQLRMCLGQMGASPADRSKVMIPDEPEEDAADRHFN